jgi:hypothetical protein
MGSAKLRASDTRTLQSSTMARPQTDGETLAIAACAANESELEPKWQRTFCDFGFYLLFVLALRPKPSQNWPRKPGSGTGSTMRNPAYLKYCKNPLGHRIGQCGGSSPTLLVVNETTCNSKQHYLWPSNLARLSGGADSAISWITPKYDPVIK